MTKPTDIASREPNSACVVLFNPANGLVLAERHVRGWGLPGGRREVTDASSFECAARELREETGVVMKAARSVLTYQAGPHWCEAFLALNVMSLPTDAEAEMLNAAWVEPEALIGHEGRFPAYCARLFARIASQESLKNTTTRVSKPIDWEKLRTARSAPAHLNMFEQALTTMRDGKGAIVALDYQAEVVEGPHGAERGKSVVATFKTVLHIEAP